MRDAWWPTDVFASRVHERVRPFAMSAGPWAGVCATIAGPQRPGFASLRQTVRKPLHV